MANNFFSRFPKIDYNMDGQGSFLTLTNIVKNVDVNDLYANNSTFYTYHEILDGERPDTISYRLYGTPNYYWTFFILNNELRGGLNSSWPISYQQMERMLANEYDPYSVITISPVDSDPTKTGIGYNGMANLIYLWKEYIPYIRLSNNTGTEWAKILKYDHHLLQLVVYDIEKADGSGPPSSIDNFVDSVFFKIAWSNPYDPLSEDEDEVARYDNCVRLRDEFIDRTQATYAEFDLEFANIDPDSIDEDAGREEIDAAIKDYNDRYVFNKIFLPAGENYRWASYRNAASEYYETIDDVNYSVSAYDVVTNEDIVEPKYISFYEKEELINASKTKIRVIRPDKINDFANAYFDILNGR